MTGKKRKEGEPLPPLAWVAAAIGLVFVVGSAGFMVYTALNKSPSPPDIGFRVVSVTRSGSGHLVEADVFNRGRSVAAELVIQGELKDGTQTVETRTLTLTYVPPGSHRKAGLFFTRDPRSHRLELSAVGYEEP